MDFAWRDFNTAIKSDGTRNLYLTENSEGANIVYYANRVNGPLSWEVIPTMWNRAGGDPLSSGVTYFTIIARNAYWFGGDIDTGELPQWKCPPECTAGYWDTCYDLDTGSPYPCYVCTAYYNGDISVTLWASGTRNSPDEANLVNPADTNIPHSNPNGFPHGANIGVTTGAVTGSDPTRPILNWSSWNSAQERWHVQVDNNSDFSSPEWNSVPQPGANTSVQTSVLPSGTYYWRVAVCGDTKNKTVAGPRPWTTSASQLCTWTAWANGDNTFVTTPLSVCSTVYNNNTFHVCYFDGIGASWGADPSLAQFDDAFTPSPVGAWAGFDRNWGAGQVDATGKVDSVSGIWRGRINFQGGLYTFHTISDDGVELTVDGFGVVISNWTDHGAIQNDSSVLNIPAGSRNVTLRWYENGGDARIRLWWDYTSNPPTASNLQITSPNYCSANPAYLFSWSFCDPSGSNESQFQFQVDDNSDFSSPVVDRTVSGLNNPSPTTNTQAVLVSGSPSPDRVVYGTTYYWRVKVWDSNGADSGWIYPP